jgi:8-oxo-dGTP diphosphatase
MSTKKVLCAIVHWESKILVVQRSERMSLPLKWEFPGGKLEPNESEEACLLRELREELNIEVALSRKLSPSVFHYPHISVELIPYIAHYLRGEIQLKEHKMLKLLSKEELLPLDWAEADLPIVKEFLRL